MNDEITAMMDEIKAMRRLRQWNAVHCITHGIIAELPRCHHCGVLYPCDYVDPMEYREPRKPVRVIYQDGKREIY